MNSNQQGKSARTSTTKEQITLAAIDATALAEEGFDMLCGILSALIDKAESEAEQQLARAGWHIAYDYLNNAQRDCRDFTALKGGEV